MPVYLTRKIKTPEINTDTAIVNDAPRAPVTALLRELGSRDPRLHPEIVQELIRHRDTVLVLLADQIARQQALIPVIYLLCMTGQLLAWTARRDLEPVLAPPIVFALGVLQLVLCLLPLATLLYRPVPKSQASAVRLLILMDDVRAIPTLIDVHESITLAGLSTDKKHLSNEVRAALVQLLPRLSYADGGILTAKRRKQLRQILRLSLQKPFIVGSIDPYLVFAIVKVLVQIRDIDSLEVLRDLAKKSRDAKIRDIAALGVLELDFWATQ